MRRPSFLRLAASDTWSCMEPMPLPRHGVASVALEDVILVPGGALIAGLAPTDHVDVFVPDPVAVRPQEWSAVKSLFRRR